MLINLALDSEITHSFELDSSEHFLSFVDQAVDEHNVSILVCLMRYQEEKKKKMSLGAKLLGSIAQKHKLNKPTLILRRYTFDKPFRYYDQPNYKRAWKQKDLMSSTCEDLISLF